MAKRSKIVSGEANWSLGHLADRVGIAGRHPDRRMRFLRRRRLDDDVLEVPEFAVM
jgi:hypothetical protein